MYYLPILRPELRSLSIQSLTRHYVFDPVEWLDGGPVEKALASSQVIREPLRNVKAVYVECDYYAVVRLTNLVLPCCVIKTPLVTSDVRASRATNRSSFIQFQTLPLELGTCRLPWEGVEGLALQDAVHRPTTGIPWLLHM